MIYIANSVYVEMMSWSFIINYVAKRMTSNKSFSFTYSYNQRKFVTFSFETLYCMYTLSSDYIFLRIYEQNSNYLQQILVSKIYFNALIFINVIYNAVFTNND